MDPHTDLDDIIAVVREAFLARAARDVRAMEQAALDLAKPRRRRAGLELLIRAAHTLRGTAGTIGLPGIGSAAGDVEAVARAPRLSPVRLAAAVERLAAEARRAAEASGSTAPAHAD